MSAQETPATRPIGFASSASVCGGRRARTREVTRPPRPRARASRARTAGTSNGPSVSQRRAPLTGSPRTSTAASSRMLTASRRRSDAPPPHVWRPRADDERDEPGQREHRLAHEVVHRLAVADRRARRSRAVHHDQPEGDEAERDENEDVGLELGPLHPFRFCTRRRNSSPRCSKSRNWSKLAHAGESSTISPVARVGCRRRDGRREIAAPLERDARADERGVELVRGLPDQVDGANATRSPGASVDEVLALQRAAEDDVQRRVVRRERASPPRRSSPSSR